MMPKLGDEYGTPDDLYEALAFQFGPFDMDGAAQPGNTKLAKFTSDASMETWEGRVWCNPPFSHGKLKYFCGLADEYARYWDNMADARAHTVTMLCRCDVSTKWWQNCCHNRPVYMLRKRVQFVGATQGYNFPVAVVHFKGHPPQAAQYRYLETWP